MATFCEPLEAALDTCTGAEAGPRVDAGVPALADGGATSPSASDAQTPLPMADAGSAAGPARDAASPTGTTADAGHADASVPRTDAGSDAGSDAGPIALSCEPAADDEACDLCLKGSCCSEFSACGPGSDCFAMVDCIEPCETSSCYDACEAAHPQGALAFAKILDCNAERCGEVCGDDEPMPSMNVRPPPADKCLPTCGAGAK